MIDKRELLEKTRERSLTLAIIEKDYVIGWLLFGLSRIHTLVFKGGTALSKVYFPTTWRLSEDVDFANTGTHLEIANRLNEVFALIKEKSGIGFTLKRKYSNPDYLQLKIQHAAILGKNWVKMDVTRETPLDETSDKDLQRTYSDYPSFKVKTESIEEIFAEKLRAIIERTKSRDYYDVWRLTGLGVNQEKAGRFFRKKCEAKDISFQGIDQLFPKDIAAVLKPYWERELGRLVHPLPRLERVLKDLKSKLDFLSYNYRRPGPRCQNP